MSQQVRPEALSATTPRTTGWSRYVSLDSRAAFETYMRRIRFIRVAFITCAVLAGLFAIGSSLRNDWLGYGTGLAVVIILILPCRFAIAREFHGLNGIVNDDCDPQKMLDVVVQLQAASRSKRNANALAYTYALCSFYLGYCDVAEQWLNTLRLRRTTDQWKLLIASQRFGFATAHERWDEAVAVRDGFQTTLAGIHCGERSRHDYEFVSAMMDATIAVHEGRYDQAREGIGMMKARATCCLQLVSIDRLEARLLLAEDRPVDVRPHLQVVAFNGGTLAMADEARAWLAAHPA